MSDRFRLDTSLLTTTASRLRDVASTFDGANAASDAIGDALGHAGLAGAVHDFAHEWDDKRADMVAGIAELAKASDEIGEQLEGWDASFAQALRGGS